MEKVYTNELEFESELVKLLVEQKGWKGSDRKSPILKFKSEEDLIDNWAEILYENNSGTDKLNHIRLTEGEKAQLLEQVEACKTPNEANQLINGGSISIKRDAPEDKLHYGKEVSLKIYDRQEIGGGQSVYQIAEQPIFKARNKVLPDRRGDLMLLINGLPVIHIELKRSGISVMQAVRQIEKYSHENVFTGFFGLIQVFVAMEPKETRYFANPGNGNPFNEDFMFHWEDIENQRVDNWYDIAEHLLSIPMAHQLIGFYTVADSSDGILKVLRSYQYWAVNAIWQECLSHDWKYGDSRGGYVWHTTGSGKTLTSFKSAQLMAQSGKADKVVFLVDRIELGTQSLSEYRGFASATETVNATEDTEELKTLLKDDSASSTLIVTSIQKMDILCKDPLNKGVLEKVNSKHIVIVVDECHRSVFSKMMEHIKDGLPNALMFGFTGTPIVKENAREGEVTTADVFGNEICRYTIADGIRDNSVLGFDVSYMSYFEEEDLRKEVALHEVKARTVEEAMSDERKKSAYLYYMLEVPMVSRHQDAEGGWHTGIEGMLPKGQYVDDLCRRSAVKDVVKGWPTLSIGGKYHAIFATSSIPEAIEYYRLFKELAPNLKVTALFDPNIDNSGGQEFKEDGLIEILEDYNARYKKSYSLSNYTTSDPHRDSFKRDVANRLAHKKPYSKLHLHPDEQLDLLIVVDQMLTGYDSKWLNTLYMDKVMEYAPLIQAFSRTNRILDSDKPFGSIRTYRMPATMKDNVEKALFLYAKGAERVMFVPKLKENLESMERSYAEIESLFINHGVVDFSNIPDTDGKRSLFALAWRQLNEVLTSAKVQGFRFDIETYGFTEADGEWYLVSENLQAETNVERPFDEGTYLTLATRYKELFSGGEGTGGWSVPYDLDPNLMKIDTTRINYEYLDEKFETWLKVRIQNDPESERAALAELHSEFARLSAEDQMFAELIIQRIQMGEQEIDSSWDLNDYINHAKRTKEDELVESIVNLLCIDESLLRNMMARNPKRDIELNEHGAFDELKASANFDDAQVSMERIYGKVIKPRVVNRTIDAMLREFLLLGMFDARKELGRFL